MNRRDFMKAIGGAGMTGLAGGFTAIPILTKAGAPGSETSAPAHTATLADVPNPPREFRAVWIATVNNIDWPSKRGLSVAIAPGDDQVVRQWVIRIWDGTRWNIDLLPGTQRIYRLKQTNPPALVKAVVVSAVDRAGNEGPMAEVSVPVS